MEIHPVTLINMKKSELKTLIQEVISEWNEPYVSTPDAKLLKMMSGKKIKLAKSVSGSEIKIIFSDNESVTINASRGELNIYTP